MREIKLENLTNDEFYTYDEILVEDDHMNFVWELWFDVDKYFGTNSRETDCWLNFYTNWYDDGHITACYVIDYPNGDIKDEKWILTPEETEFIRKKMTNRVKECGYNSIAEAFVAWKGE